MSHNLWFIGLAPLARVESGLAKIRLVSSSEFSSERHTSLQSTSINVESIRIVFNTLEWTTFLRIFDLSGLKTEKSETSYVSANDNVFDDFKVPKTPRVSFSLNWMTHTLWLINSRIIFSLQGRVVFTVRIVKRKTLPLRGVGILY